MAEEMKKPAAETEEEYQPDLMTLEDEDGNEVTFEVIDALDHKGVHYLAVVEYAENEDDLDEDAQLVILSVGEDDEGEYLDVVEDDETLLEVSKLFEKRLSDQFEIDLICQLRKVFLPDSICCGLYDPTNQSTGAWSSPVDCRPPRHGSTMKAR